MQIYTISLINGFNISNNLVFKERYLCDGKYHILIGKDEWSTVSLQSFFFKHIAVKNWNLANVTPLKIILVIQFELNRPSKQLILPKTIVWIDRYFILVLRDQWGQQSNGIMIIKICMRTKYNLKRWLKKDCKMQTKDTRKRPCWLICANTPITRCYKNLFSRIVSREIPCKKKIAEITACQSRYDSQQ